MPTAHDRLKQLLAVRRKISTAAITATSIPTPIPTPTNNGQASGANNTNSGSANPIPMVHVDGLIEDKYQNAAVKLAVSGKSFVLTGPAGSGKSTTLKRIISAIQAEGRWNPLHNTAHKYLRDGTPPVVITSFTNRAVENDKNILGLEYARNCLTIHKLLEYEPVYYTNAETGKNTMSFEPRRSAKFPLPNSIKVLIIEEATLTNVPLWNTLWQALPPDIQIIQVGDIQQLPPVFGKPIFIHAMQYRLPVVELKTIYRQALESPILSLAHRILSGKIIPQKELPEWNKYSESTDSRLQVRSWPKPLSELQALVVMQQWIPTQIESGKYDPLEDVILTPFGKAGKFGAEELNRIIAWHLANSAEDEVVEIYAGMSKKYFRVGERIICKKQEAVITAIKPNPSYYGKTPRAASKYIDYSGVAHEGYAASLSEQTESDLEEELSTIDQMFSGLDSQIKDGDSISRAASHIIEVKYLDDTVEKFSAVGEVSDISLGYAMTVHKAQGSEWRRVILMVHQSQAVATYRELLYTAITRARQELVIICEPNTFVKGVVSQRLPGTTLDQKLESFDRYIKQQQSLGGGNKSEVPIGLEDLIARNVMGDSMIEESITEYTEELGEK